ncbi:MAG: hypothetical protein JOZ07_14345 [Solirubrobacterales bacterium]|nr:hypothetical protein [Solirubrobacterales bacterium]
MDDNDSFEERLRAIAKQISDSVEQISQLDLDRVAESFGVDVERARQFAEAAGQWLQDRVEGRESRPLFSDEAPPARPDPAAPTASRPGPDPRDMPTEPQGLALSALNSGRWTVQPGSNVIKSTGEGPPPADAAELVGDLRARDWISADGTLTVIGQRALTRWYEAARETSEEDSDHGESPVEDSDDGESPADDPPAPPA